MASRVWPSTSSFSSGVYCSDDQRNDGLDEMKKKRVGYASIANFRRLLGEGMVAANSEINATGLRLSSEKVNNA
jgi:5-methylthioribose kinase